MCLRVCGRDPRNGLSGATSALLVGITLAAISAVASFFFIRYQPVWAILIIALDVLVIAVHATPAEHRSARLTLRSAPSLGLVVSGSRRVDFAGDADLFEEINRASWLARRRTATRRRLGSKLGPGHLDPVRGTLPAAAEAADRRPDPLGTLSPLNRTASADPPKAFRRHAAELAQVEVRILEPGDALTL